MRKYLKAEVVKMTKKKNPCGCGCIPQKRKEVKKAVPVKTKQEAPKKTKE